MTTSGLRSAFVLSVMAASFAAAQPPSATPELDPQTLRATDAPANGVWLDSLDLSTWQQRRQRAKARMSLGGKSITMNGVVYPHGVGTLTINEFLIDVKGEAEAFVAMVGIDDEMKTGRGTANFEIWADDPLRATPVGVSGRTRSSKYGRAPSRTAPQRWRSSIAG